MTLTAAWFWPSVNSRKDALFAIEEAFWISVIASIFSLIFVLIEFLHGQESDFDILGLATSVFFAGVAFGIRRKSRIAATAGLVMYVLLRIFLLPPTGLRELHDWRTNRVGAPPRRARNVCISQLATLATRDAEH